MALMWLMHGSMASWGLGQCLVNFMEIGFKNFLAFRDDFGMWLDLDLFDDDFKT